MANDRIEWTKKKRKVYNKDLGKQVDIDFLSLNITDDYNYGMGQVDISDQLRGVYRMDHWLRNFKWWHALFCGG